MHIGVNVDESAKLKLITTQSMPEGMCESLNSNVSISYPIAQELRSVFPNLFS